MKIQKVKKTNNKRGALGEIVFMLIIIGIVAAVGVFFFSYINKNKKVLNGISTDKNNLKIFDIDGNGKTIAYQMKKDYQLEVPVIPGRLTLDKSATKLNAVSGFQEPVEGLSAITVVFVDNSNKDKLYNLEEVEDVVNANYNYTLNDLKQVRNSLVDGRMLRSLNNIPVSFAVKLDPNYKSECMLEDANGDCYILSKGRTFYILIDDLKNDTQADAAARTVYQIFVSMQK